MLTVVLLAHRIDLIMGTDFIKGGAIYFYLVNELISITENYAKIGLPLPAKLRQAIAVLKKQEDQEYLMNREWAKPQQTPDNIKQQAETGQTLEDDSAKQTEDGSQRNPNRKETVRISFSYQENVSKYPFVIENVMIYFGYMKIHSFLLLY